MKTENPTQPILSARTALVNTRAMLDSLRGFYEAINHSLQDAIINGDLTAVEGVEAITRLRTLDFALPLRIQAEEANEERQARELIEAANAFIGLELSPRARQARSRVSEKVRAELKPHYPNPHLLEIQVAQSDLVNRFAAVVPSITNAPYGGALACAQAVLDGWEKLAELEAQIS